MKTRIHAIAGVIGFLTILTFWLSTAYSELFGTYETIATIKTMVLRGMLILIPAMIIAGGSGTVIGKKRTDATAMAKKKRMPIIAANGFLILLPAAIFLEAKASATEFDTLFYLVQTLEIFAGATNITLMGLNIRDGLTMTGRIGTSSIKEKRTSTDISIEEREGGPLIVRGVTHITDQDGKILDTKKVTALCRCGASKNKPYCDGTHNEIDFDSRCAENHTPDELKKFNGKDITVHYNRLLCSHAGECSKLLNRVFDPSREPWIIPDNGTTDEIISVIKACPSGALSYSEDGHDLHHEIIDKDGICVEKNGPYRIINVPLVSPRPAQGACLGKLTLCRCGASKNKPYCDGRHYDINWCDDV